MAEKAEQFPPVSGGKTQELPGMKGKGVEVLKIASIDKAADLYESEKDKRCKMTPKEVAAKSALQDALHKNREKLPQDDEGNRYYRYEGRDYVLEEKLKVKKIAGAADED